VDSFDSARDARRRCSVIAAIVLFALAVVVSTGGYLLPAQGRLTRRASIQAPADAVFAAVASPSAWADWCPWLDGESTSCAVSGPSSGAGARATWTSKYGDVSALEIVSSDAPASIAYRFTPKLGEFEMRGEFRLSAGNGTIVEWTVDVDAGMSPFARYALALRELLFGPELDRGLARLAETIGVHDD